MSIPKMKYRLALDLGTTSIGWAIFRLTETTEGNYSPVAVIRAGVRIFPNGRSAARPGEQGESLAVTRRTARAMRRNRDRKLKRKAALMDVLIELAFFPPSERGRKELDRLDPFALRAKGIREQLTPPEFARAVFHLNQRRGFLSNRKTDKKDNESGALKAAIKRVREVIAAENCITVGEWLAKRHMKREPVRARYREVRVQKPDGKTRIDKSYDLYVDRAMVEQEFDAIWAKQAEYSPEVFDAKKRERIKGVIFYQRPLKPVKPGRCSFLPEEERAPLALPSVHRFRILQELNNLAVLSSGAIERALSKEQRDEIAKILFREPKCTFTKIARTLRLGGATRFNLQDAKRDELKGDSTAAQLSKDEHFGAQWHQFPLERQDAVVEKLIGEEDANALLDWLQSEFGIDENRAEKIANARLPEGYGSLSRKALSQILPELSKDVVPFSLAAKNAGFHHSQLSHAEGTGEILATLPYYAEKLQRHVGFGTGNPADVPEKRFGRIANPTVHIGLNEVRKVVNTLIKRYGHPSEIAVEVTRELKQGNEQRKEVLKRQAENQKTNERHFKEAQQVLTALPGKTDVLKMKLWEELNPSNVMERRCPYSGEQIGIATLMSDAVEIEHILPFARTLDDSLNNKTVCMRRANRDKGNRTPFEAFGHSPSGYDYAAILARVDAMHAAKRKRFAPDAYEKWLKEDKDFVARALNDTAYLSRVVREYLSLICPPNRVIAIPGRLTGLLRAKLGLNDILGLRGEKNRNDHRHHAVDACVIGVTDRSLLQRVASASASAREAALGRLLDSMPEPFSGYRSHVERSISAILVSHRPNHSYEGEFFDATNYGILDGGLVTYRHEVDGKRVRPPLNRKVEVFAEASAKKGDGSPRHGADATGGAKPYKGLWSRSNYCVEIFEAEGGGWQAEVIERFRAYRIAATGANGVRMLKDKNRAQNGRRLLLRLMIDDLVRARIEGKFVVLRVMKIAQTGDITFNLHNEANVADRYSKQLMARKAKEQGQEYDAEAIDDKFFQKAMSPGTLRALDVRAISVSPIGESRLK